MASEAQLAGFPVCVVPMPDSESASMLDTFQRVIITGARTNMARDGFLTPVAAMLGRDLKGDGWCCYFASLGRYMENEQGKEILAKVLPNLAERFGAVAFAMITEAWTVRVSDEKSIADVYARYGSLQHHPDRIEVVSVTIETRMRASMISLPIERDEDGNFTKLGDDIAREYGEASEVRGRFANFLKPLPGGLN